MKKVQLFEQFINTIKSLNERRGIPTSLSAKHMTISDDLDLDAMINDIISILRYEWEGEFDDAKEIIEGGDFGVDSAMMKMLYIQLLKSLENEYDALIDQSKNKNVKGGDFYLSWTLEDLKGDIKDNVKDIIKNKKGIISDALYDMEDFEVANDNEIKYIEDQIKAAKEYRKSLDSEMELAVKPGMFDDDPAAYDKFGNVWGEKMNKADEKIEDLEKKLDDLKYGGGSGIDLDDAEKKLNKYYSKATKEFENFVKQHLLTI